MEKYIKKNIFSLRPKYRRASPLPPCHVIDKIQEELADRKEIEGQTEGNDAVLRICKESANRWSPELNAQVLKRGKGSNIKAVMIPAAKLRTIFIILYAIALVLFFLGVLMLVYKWVFQFESTLAWSIPVGILVAVATYLLGKISLLKSKDQMKKLWKFFDEAINTREKKQKDLLNELFPDEDIMI